jgi:hypothetical protein
MVSDLSATISRAIRFHGANGSHEGRYFTVLSPLEEEKGRRRKRTKRKVVNHINLIDLGEANEECPTNGGNKFIFISIYIVSIYELQHKSRRVSKNGVL